MAKTPLTIRNDTELADIVAAIDTYTDAMKVLRGVADDPHETSDHTAGGGEG